MRLPHLVLPVEINPLLPILFQYAALLEKPSFLFDNVIHGWRTLKIFKESLPYALRYLGWQASTTSTSQDDINHHHLETLACVQTVKICIKSLSISTAGAIRCRNTWVVALMSNERYTDVPSVTQAAVVRNARTLAGKKALRRSLLPLYRHQLARPRCTRESFNCQRPLIDTSLIGMRRSLPASIRTSTFVPCANAIESHTDHWTALLDSPRVHLISRSS